jgi:hypothetical protein
MTEFTTARSVGGLLPPDLMHAIVANEPELGGLAPTDYGLPAADRLGEAAARAWAKGKNHWASFRSSVEDLPASESGVTQTRDQWLLPILRDLGFSPSFSAQAEAVGARRYGISHRDGSVPIHLVSFRQSLDHGAPAASGQRRAAPHSVLQDYLNAADDVLYGILSNGYVLRLLRKNASLTRQAYVEFNLQEMLEGAVYADFVLLFLVLHRSRFPRASTDADRCWLEQWRAKAESQGTRALGKLREGVAQAIRVLGNGFLRHPANRALRGKLNGGELDPSEYYRQLLRLVYRLIFLFVAEERDLIFEPGADGRVKGIYNQLYSASRLRDLARRNLADDRHDDLWRGLQRTFALVSGQHSALDVPALGGGLFDRESAPDLDSSLLHNDAVAEAIQYMSWVRVGRVPRRVSYRNLDVEELGGVYEGLLDRQPHFSAADPEHPVFDLVGGGERKQTGSYYTPSSLVDELVRSALDPVISERLSGARTPADRERALLSLAVCDTAAGSGHFLLAAARRVAGELARVRAGDHEPSPPELRQAVRDVVRHCIYGVDINPLAVDLCRLSLWLESHDAGCPLTFLDHRVKLGNSLVGATLELVTDGIPDGAFVPVADDDRSVAAGWKKRNRQEQKARAREGERQATFLGADGGVRAEWARIATSLAAEVRAIADLPEDDPLQVAQQQARYEAYRSRRLDPAAAVLDAWTAAFFWPLRADDPAPVTTADLHVPPGQPPSLAPEQWTQVANLRVQHRFFHWQLEFPEVFERGGFDCVLGNPPWEKIKLQELEFFAERDPVIAQAPNKAARQKLIELLPERDPALARAFVQAKRTSESQSAFARASGRFPLTAVGDVNSYALFAEHDRRILNNSGRAGLVVPTGIGTDDTTKGFFQAITDEGGLATFFRFFEIRLLFPDTESRNPFSLLTLSRSPVESGDLAFFLTSTADLRDQRRRFQLSPEDFALLNPNTRTCPIFRTSRDAELTRAIYRRVPVLINEQTGLNPWAIDFLRMLDMANDSGMFQDAPGPELAPLYEAKLFHQFDHRYATYEGATQEQLNMNVLPRLPAATKADPAAGVRPRYWVETRSVDERIPPRVPRTLWHAFQLGDLQLVQDAYLLWVAGHHLNAGNTGYGREIIDWLVRRGRIEVKPWNDSEEGCRKLDLESPLDPQEIVGLDVVENGTVMDLVGALIERRARRWLLAFRDIARATDERTTIASVLPRVGVGHTAPLILAGIGDHRCVAALLGNLNSLVLDYAARQKVGGTHLTYTNLNQFPVIPPSGYRRSDLDFIVPRVLELTYTACDLQAFAKDLGYHGPPFVWDEERRAVLRAELDAYFAALYGVTCDELRYILDPADVEGAEFPGETFRVLKNNETKHYREYRTRRLVLEAWDSLGLEPRNRDGKYEVQPVAKTSSRASQARPLDKAPGAARPSVSEVSGGRSRSASPLSTQAVRERVRTRARTIPLLARDAEAPRVAHRETGPEAEGTA